VTKAIEQRVRSAAAVISLLSVTSVQSEMLVHRRRLVRDDDANPWISLLHLAGVVRVVEGALRVRNRIYFAVFDQDWIRVHLPPTRARASGRRPGERQRCREIV
jgi:hypothetical protein